MTASDRAALAAWDRAVEAYRKEVPGFDSDFDLSCHGAYVTACDWMKLSAKLVPFPGWLSAPESVAFGR